MKTKRVYIILLSFISLLLAQSAKAVCPVCTVAVCAGVGLSRWLGIDDVISGVWIGGLIVSMIIWTLEWLNKKKYNFKLRGLAIILFYYLIIIIPLYWKGIVGHPQNKFLGIDKILFGIGTGTLAFLIGFWLNNLLKKKNQGKAYFPFQKVVLPVGLLIIASLIFHLIIGCNIKFI
jgi:hypothetical protein